MSNDMNLCLFIGRLGKEPEIKYLPDGKPVANFSIACGQTWKDKNSGEKQEKTEWVRVVAFGKLAEIIGNYLHKGSQVHISGRMQTRKWTDKEGKDHYTTEIVADTMQMLGGKPKDDDAPSDKLKEPTPGAGDFDDEIPF